MRTFEIPTANGYVSVQANSKQEAIASVPDAKLNKPQSVKGVNFVTPDNVPTQAFDSSKNISIKPQATSTGAQGMSAQIESMAKTNQDTFTRNLEERAKQLEAERATSKDMYLQSLLGSQGEKQLTQEAYAKTVDPLQQELTDINNQIMAEQNAVRRRLQELDKNTQGLFGGALQDEKNRIERESLAKQADLSVIQMARQGKYDSAKEIADRAIQVRLEQQKTINEALKFNYEENRDLFTKAEQRAFETAQADRERMFKREEADLKEISDISLIALQNGAPSSIAAKMRNAKTPSEAMALAGSYMMSYQEKKARAEYEELVNPTTANAVPKELIDLKPADREPLINARATVSEIDEIKQILNRNSGNLSVLEIGATDDARRFKQLRSNVVDKLARERTGAVIGNDEKRDFKKILGVGLRQLAIKDISEINQGLDSFKNKHTETIKFIDPTGKVGQYFDQTIPYNMANNIINQYTGSATGSTSLNNY